MNELKTKAAEIGKQIRELMDSAEAQESKEMLKFHGWLKDFKPSAYLKGIKREIVKLEKQLAKMAKKAGQSEWDAILKDANLAPECYDYEALTEY